MPFAVSSLGQALIAIACAAVLASPMAASARSDKVKHSTPKNEKAARASAAEAVPLRDGEAEKRLLEIYRLASEGRAKEALPLAERLVKDHPNFQLAQLALGDLLAAKVRPLGGIGDVSGPPPATMMAPSGKPGIRFANATAAAPASSTQPATLVSLSPTASDALADLRNESRLRVDAALKARPPEGTVPAQFLELSTRSRHAIAMDTSRSRLYLFENTDKGMVLVADYYASVGKSGIEKLIEGDQRTPLGVYYITSRLDPATLKDFYGSGALPINYPNPLDVSRGKTGSGIWLHGTPPEQFSRAPLATDGCLALANPDLQRILQTVEPRSTPVVIAKQLQWVKPQALHTERQSFHQVLEAWRQAKSQGDMPRLLGFYAPEFQSYRNVTRADWSQTLQSEAKVLRGRSVNLKDKTLLRWTDTSDTMVVTFGEIPEGARTGTVKRQYWTRKGQQWQIFFEGVIG